MRRLIGAAAAVVAALAVTGVAAWSSRSSARAVPPGIVISEGMGTYVLTTSDGTGSRPAPELGGTEPIIVDSSDRLIAEGATAATIGRLDGDHLALTGPTIRFPGSQWHLVGFAGHGTALLAEGPGPADIPLFSLAEISTRQVSTLGTGDTAAGDPAGPGAFIVVPSSSPLPAGLLPGTVVDYSAELADAGSPPKLIVTSQTIATDLAEPAATPLHLTLIPDSSGDRLAIVATSVLASDAGSLSGLVVVDRAGTVLGVVGPEEGVGGRVAWSPDGRSLVYVTASGGSAALAHWQGGDAVSVTAIGMHASPPERLSDPCLAGPPGAGFLCDVTVSTGPGKSAWVLEGPGGGRPQVAASPLLPVGWLP